MREDVFGVTEGIVLRYFPDYNPLGPNDIPIVIGLAIAEDWQKASEKLVISDPHEVLSILNLEGEYGQFIFNEIQNNKVSIAKMLSELAALVKDFYNANEWICILGI